MLLKLKNNKNYIWAFLIPFLIFLLLCFSLGFLYPDGEAFYISDLDAQYKALFTFYRENGLVGYSFSKGLGGSMFGTYAYYLASPLNAITFLFPTKYIHLSMLLILGIKLSLASLTMYIFLYQHFKEKKYLLLFAIIYAFIGFNAAYYFHLMWFDAVYLLPLIMTGIDQILKNKKSILYIVSLFLCMVTNYYMSFLVCIFSLIYFLYQLFLQNSFKLNKKKMIGITKKFIISSILTAIMASFVLIPTVLEIKDMSKTDIHIFSETGLAVINDPVNFLSRFFIGSHEQETLLSNNIFHVYTSIFVVLLIFLYFINRKIPRHEKYLSLGVLAFFILSMFMNYVDLLWYGFQIPICFSGRYIFMFSFFLLILSVRSFQNIDKLEKKHFYLVAPIFPVFGTYLLFYNKPYIHTYLIWVSVFLSLIYLVLLYQMGKKKNTLLSLLLFLLVCSELFMNYFFTIYDFEFHSVEEVVGYYEVNQKEISKLRKNNTFYRMEKNYKQSAIDSMYFNYHGLDGFISTLDKKQIQFMGKMGYNVYNNTISYNNYLPVSDSILGMKYLMTKNSENLYLKEIKQFLISATGTPFYGVFDVPVYMYQNDSALALGTFVKNDLSEYSLSKKNIDRLAIQNQMLSYLLGRETSVYEKIDMDRVDKNVYKFKNTKQADIYLYPGIELNYLFPDDIIHFYINDIKLGTYLNNEFDVQYFENRAKQDYEFTTRIEDRNGTNKEYPIYAYYYNNDLMKESFKELNENPMEIVAYKDSYIKAKATVLKDHRYLFTTIPYEKNWNVFVDGKKVKIDSVFDMFIGLSMEEGEHIIEFKYRVAGLKEGVLFSLLGLFITIMYIQEKKKTN